MITGYIILLAVMNASLIVGTACLAIWQWSSGRISVGAVAMVLPLTWQITNMAGWVARSVTSIFENIGTVQDGMKSIAVERQMPDPPDARELRVTRGEIRFEDLHFDYGRQRRPERGGVLHGIDLRIAPGERVGLVGTVGRRQVDAGEPAAALLRPRARPHPDRRPGHRHGDAGEPAHPDRHGDAGHVAAASLDPRQHPLRPPAGDARR